MLVLCVVHSNVLKCTERLSKLILAAIPANWQLAKCFNLVNNEPSWLMMMTGVNEQPPVAAAAAAAPD